MSIVYCIIHVRNMFSITAPVEYGIWYNLYLHDFIPAQSGDPMGFSMASQVLCLPVLVSIFNLCSSQMQHTLDWKSLKLLLSLKWMEEIFSHRWWITNILMMLFLCGVAVIFLSFFTMMLSSNFT